MSVTIRFRGCLWLKQKSPREANRERFSVLEKLWFHVEPVK